MADMMYPKSGGLFLLAEINRLTANVSDLIDACVAKDQKIAELEAAQQKTDLPEGVVAVVAPPTE